MTIPTGAGMQTALSGLQAYMAAIDTTGENIANANTPGYSRQQVQIGDADPLTIVALSSNTGAGAQLGTGASIDGITRERDTFLDTQYRTQNSASSYWSTMSTQLGQVQTALAEPSTASISTALQGLYSAFDAMSTTDNANSQAAVVTAANTVISTMQAVSGQMGTVQTQAGQQLGALTQAGGTVAQDAAQIASLNGQIKLETTNGLTPNGLLDQRDTLLDNLSALAPTTATPDANGDGGVTVSFGGQTLVDAAGNVTLPTAAQITANPSAYQGQLGALATLADTSSAGAIQSLSGQLDGVASDLVTAVNGAFGSTVLTGSSVATLGASGAAAALAAPTATATDAANVAALAGGTTDQAYAQFVGAVGDAVQSAQSSSSTSQSLLSAVSNQRQSVSGVSLDEEMSNLITFQQGYQASARMMSTMSSVINDLITTVGAGL